MTLPELVAFMRENNILQLKHEGTEILLSPQAELPPPAKEPDKTVGKRGLTKQEELDLFNQVFPEDFAS